MTTTRSRWKLAAGHCRRPIVALALLAGGLPAAGAADVSKAPAAEAPQPAAPTIQMAILLDTSGSMTGLINQARTQLWKMVNEFATAKRDGQPPQLQVALYEYGNDGLEQADGWIRQIVPFTDDLDRVSEALFALTTSGGSEHCGQVIDRAVSELAWSRADRDLKCIFIAGNEPFTQGPVDFREACKAAIEKGITVSTIHCGSEQDGVSGSWQEGAVLADGTFMSIDQNQAVAQIKTPQDKELAELSVSLNTTYVAFGDEESRQYFLSNQAVQDTNAIHSCPSAAATRAQFKATALYCNYRWDLCDALRMEKIKLEDLKPEQLPEELRKLSPEELTAHVEKKQAEREKIQEQIKSLSAERDKYIAKVQREQADSAEAGTLDSAVIESVRTQLVRKQFVVE